MYKNKKTSLKPWNTTNQGVNFLGLCSDTSLTIEYIIPQSIQFDSDALNDLKNQALHEGLEEIKFEIVTKDNGEKEYIVQLLMKLGISRKEIEEFEFASVDRFRTLKNVKTEFIRHFKRDKKDIH